MIRQTVWLDCDEPGCPHGTTADSHHVANLTAPGGWYCPRHDTQGGPLRPVLTPDTPRHRTDTPPARPPHSEESA